MQLVTQALYGSGAAIRPTRREIVGCLVDEREVGSLVVVATEHGGVARVGTVRPSQLVVNDPDISFTRGLAAPVVSCIRCADFGSRCEPLQIRKVILESTYLYSPHILDLDYTMTVPFRSVAK
jgi:hypothetical protein